MRAVKLVLSVSALLLALPLAASAQATLTGLVRDSSGAVLPGVTVEATSPVLIEKVRSSTTDSTGRYTIPDLRPGLYRMSFALTGFTTVIREKVELLGTSVITINADMAVGNLQETITVSGATPAVDLQSTTRQISITQELVSALPSSRTPFALGVLIPGVTQSFGGRDVGGTVVAEVAALAANGGRTGDQRMMVNGVALSSGIAGGWGGGAVPNATGTAEFAIDVSGVDAQAATGGVRVNFIPRDGGNTFSGTIVGNYARGAWASDNYTGTGLRERGLSTPGTIKENGEFNPGFGGPILRDKMWFFASGKYVKADNFVPNMFFNANANKLNEFRYARSTEQAILHQDQQILALRLTYQINAKNKIGGVFDQEAYCGCPFGTTATVAPDGSTDRRFPNQRFVTMDWTSPVTNNLLLEASGIHRIERWGNMHLQTGKGSNLSAITPGMISVTDNPNPVTGGSLTYRSAAQYNNSWNWNIHYRAAVSYITGSHNFKVGFNNAYLHHDNTTYTDPSAPYSYSFASGVPTQITYRIAPRSVAVNVNYDFGMFVQDKWTIDRLTLMGGLRFDAFKNSFPAQSIAPTVLAPNLNVRFDEIDNLNWKDITPKMGATYDLFGNGRTALKVTLNKYLEGLGTTGIGNSNVSEAPNPINRLNTQTTRTWNDNTFGPGDPRSGNFVPDCTLLNFTAHGECGALLNAASFGTIGTALTSYDPDLMVGWNRRQYNWEFTGSIQQEIAPRVSTNVQFARRWYGNFRIQDDRSVSAADFDRFTLIVPTDPRLPNSGQRLTSVDLKPTAATTTQSLLVTRAQNFGDMTEVYTGVNVSVNARMQNGLTVQGGFSPGRVVTDDCDIVDDLHEVLSSVGGAPSRSGVITGRVLERCHENNGWRTGISGLAAYTVPKIDVQVSATFQNQPGAQIGANVVNYPAAPTEALPTLGTTLGRPFTGAAAGRAFNIAPAGELFIERLTQIDFRVAKIFRVGRNRVNLNFDLYNITNSNTILTENQTYNLLSPNTIPGWRSPTSTLLPRLFKLGVQYDF
jgi:hypothetical protein